MDKRISLLNDAEYEEEKCSFDDVMHQLLQAKPKHRETEKPKVRVKKKPKRAKE